jgi:DNA-binding CsgD family transcriptional regulator
VVPGKVPRGSPQSGSSNALTSSCWLILDKLDRGVVLLDARGAIVDANAVGHAVLGLADAMHERNGRFAFVDADLDVRLGQLIDTAAPPDPATETGLAVCIRRGGATPYRVLVSPVEADGEDRRIAFVVLIFAPGEHRDISLDVLTKLYGLTRAQADVARCLYRGRTVEKTATELELSLNTVRSHLKQIFFRCEVQSQAELLHALALGPLHL